PANGPVLLANLHLPITVAATTVFAGKPAPTHTQHRGFGTARCAARAALGFPGADNLHPCPTITVLCRFISGLLLALSFHVVSTYRNARVI
ncbi:MAG TPA: hypothetical protein DD418_00525, partial [Pseudomonas sp.]|nr:hypothetical protein [Pseudomonas sp.]